MEHRTQDLDSRELEVNQLEAKFQNMYSDAEIKVKSAEGRMVLVKDAEARMIEREESLKIKEASVEKQRLAYSESEAAWRGREREREDGLENRMAEKVHIYKHTYCTHTDH